MFDDNETLTNDDDPTVELSDEINELIAAHDNQGIYSRIYVWLAEMLYVMCHFLLGGIPYAAHGAQIPSPLMFYLCLFFV